MRWPLADHRSRPAGRPAVSADRKHGRKRAGVAEIREKCALWLCSQCKAGPECTCIPPTPKPEPGRK